MNQHDTWHRFCEERHQLLAASGLPRAITDVEHRFRDLLCEGNVQAGEIKAALSSLSQAEWEALDKFTTAFFREFESYAPLDRFPAFRTETERRKIHGR